MPYDPNDQETKAALKAAVDAAIEEATTGLIEKNKELLGKLKKATKEATIDPAEHQELLAAREALESKVLELTKSLKAATTEIETSKKSFEVESAFVSKLLVDNGLTEALLKAGVKPEMTKAVKSMLSAMVSLKTEGSERMAVVGDKSLNDFVQEWSESDEGKHFVTAPQNQGGGANGGSQGQQPKAWNAMTLKERSILYQQNPGQAQALMKGV